ncbi:unnamed protein product, partial [Polarella glacialis]
WVFCREAGLKSETSAWQVLSCFFGAALFAVHPMCVQTASWSSCLPYLWATSLSWLSALLYFGSFFVSLKVILYLLLLVSLLFVDSSFFKIVHPQQLQGFRAAAKQQSATQAWTLALLSALFYFAAAMCKAATLTLPAVLLLSRAAMSSPRGIVSRFDVPLWTAALAALRLAATAAGDGPGSDEIQTTVVDLDLWDNILRAAVSVFLYPWRALELCLVVAGGAVPGVRPVALQGLSDGQRQQGFL